MEQPAAARTRRGGRGALHSVIPSIRPSTEAAAGIAKRAAAAFSAVYCRVGRPRIERRRRAAPAANFRKSAHADRAFARLGPSTRNRRAQWRMVQALRGPGSCGAAVATNIIKARTCLVGSQLRYAPAEFSPTYPLVIIFHNISYAITMPVEIPVFRGFPAGDNCTPLQPYVGRRHIADATEVDARHTWCR